MSPSPLAPLLHAQELDLATMAANREYEELPVRSEIPELERGLAASERALASLQAERAELDHAEEALAAEVTQIAADIEAAELERYSGKRKDRDDAAAHDDAQSSRRADKSRSEEQELELLESMEELDGRISETIAAIEKQRAARAGALDAIAEAESSRDREVERLSQERKLLLKDIPTDVVAAYERVRTGKMSGGRGVSILNQGTCSGCRIKLPSLERKKMLDQPPEALLQCPQCRRVLVRED